MAAACDVPTKQATAVELRLIAETRIGSETDGPEYQFTTISHVVASGDNVYVVQRGVPEIRVFGNDGRYRRTIGRQGAGPGEFESMWSMGIVGDSLWSIDINLRRLSFFNLTGALISTVPFDPIPLSLGESVLFMPYPDVLMRDGDFLGFGRGAASSIDNGDITANPLMRMTPDGRAADTLAWVSITHDDMILRSARSRSYRPQPFTDAPLAVYAASARRAYVIERWAATEPNTAAVRITALGAGGDTAWVRELSYEPARLDPAIVDSIRGRLVRALAARYPREEVHRALFAPTWRTPVTAAVAGDNGTLWIRWDEDTKPGRYTVLNPDGVVVADVLAPKKVNLRWVSDSTAWGDALDENDVPTLVRYRISPVLSTR